MMVIQIYILVPWTILNSQPNYQTLMIYLISPALKKFVYPLVESNSKRSRGGNFIVKEDLLIVSALLNINLDAMQEKFVYPLVESNSKRSRGSNFIVEEDLLIVSAWLNISLDAMQGNK